MKAVPLMLALSVVALAQTPPTLARVNTFQAAPGAEAEMYDLQRDIVAVYEANKSPIWRAVWTTLGAKPSLLMMVPCANLADLNGPTWLNQQGTPLERTGRAMRRARAMELRDEQIVASVPELSWDETRGPRDPFVDLFTYRVKPGRVASFLKSRQEASAALRKIGKVKSINAMRTRYGGNVYEFRIAYGYDSLDDFTSADEVRKVMGEEKYAALLKASTEDIDSTERHIFRYRPEFSYDPKK